MFDFKLWPLTAAVEMTFNARITARQSLRLLRYNNSCKRFTMRLKIWRSTAQAKDFKVVGVGFERER
jgi:hypothetical protein